MRIFLEMMYYVSVMTVGVNLIVWSFWWSHRERQRRANRIFLNKLAGYKFETWKELKAHWGGRLEFNLDGKFDPNRHGNLLETLRVINEDAEKEWKRWNS